MGDFVAEDRVREARLLDVDLVAPGLGDVGRGRAHEAALLPRVAEEVGGDASGAPDLYPPLDRADLGVAIAHEELGCVEAERAVVDDVAPLAGKPAAERPFDAARGLPMAELGASERDDE